MLMICGYKGTGKDFLFKKLSKQETGFSWKVYSLHTNFLKFQSKIQRVAFADHLKLEVQEKFGIPINAEKDTELVVRTSLPDYIFTPRDAWIWYGKLMREQDIDYWCKKALVNLEKSVVITDWRFPNEEVYVKNNFRDVTTVRIYRKDVPIPSSNIESEHSLDHILTDFLLIPEYESIDHALQIFPQYSSYSDEGLRI